MLHEIKIDRPYFASVLYGEKTFEIRYNDRGYQKGDEVVLQETVDGIRTRNEIKVIITYVTNYNQPQNQVVFGFRMKDTDNDKR